MDTFVTSGQRLLGHSDLVREVARLPALILPHDTEAVWELHLRAFGTAPGERLFRTARAACSASR